MALGQATAAPTTALVCFGSYSTPDQESVHLFQLNLKSGSLKKLSAVDGLKNPSFLKIHPSARHPHDFLESRQLQVANRLAA